MKRNERFTQLNLYQYKNNLSPIGQKIFNVLMKNWKKEQHCSLNRFDNGGDRRCEQKRIVSNFDDSSARRPPLFCLSNDGCLSDSDRNPCTNNRDIILINDHDVDIATNSTELLPISTVQKSNNETLTVSDDSSFQFKPVQNNIMSDGSIALISQFTSTQSNPREDPNSIATRFCTSQSIQKRAVKDDSSTISVEFSTQSKPKRVRSKIEMKPVVCTHNYITKENRDIISEGLLQTRSKTIDYKNKASVTSEELFQIDPELKSVNDCNLNVTSTSLLQFSAIKNNSREDEPNISHIMPGPIDSIQNAAKEDLVNDVVGCLGFFDFSPVKEDAVEDSHNLCRLNLLEPLKFNRSKRPDNPFSGSFDLIAPIDENQVQPKEKSNVLWNDMFDIELLPKDVTEPGVKEKIIEEPNAMEEQFKICFPKERKKKMVQSDNTKEENKSKPVKRKKDKSFNKEIVTKKLKETALNTKKNAIRKEKHTKTVKNWLDTVTPNNLVETELQTNESDVSDKTEIQVMIEDKSTSLPKKQKGSAKKVVQARLANKGGVMKFDKPAERDGGGNDDTTTADPSSKAPGRVSLKKGKPKFVAPLKSQIPVKEIDFHIELIDESNWKEHLTKLQSSNSTEVYAVLTYSNGFCQLNEHSTEDDCIPDGIMLLIDEGFYYFLKTDHALSNVILNFLENRTVVCYNGKNILIFFKHNNFESELNFFIHDVQIGGSLLEPDSPPESFGALQKLAGTSPQYSVASACPRQKAAWYLTLLRDCAGKLKEKLEENSQWSLFQDIEMPVLPVIAEMEFHGIMVDTEKLQRMEGMVLSRMQAVQRQCAAAAGRPLQLGSPAQLAAELYDRLQLHARANLHVRETLAKGNKSTSEDMLRMLVPLHPLPGLILEYRRLHKAHATFLAGIRQHVKDGVLRPTWVQTAAVTGRVASNNPNVQAIPKVPFRLTPDTDNPEEALNLRSVYVSRAGRALLAADFRQVECRVFASLAADPALARALRSAPDLFTVLAAQWLKKPEEQVSGAERERTKRIVYASLYGAGVSKLMAILGVGRDHAAAVSASFHDTFPSLREFSRRACEPSAPRTPSGRARALPALRGPHPAQRARARRQAVNFLVQGTAADVCKVAMAGAHSALSAAGVHARLLLQIHDELVWELPEEQLQRAYGVVRAAMEHSGRRAGLSVPLPVTLRTGRSWGELTDITHTTTAAR